MRSLLIGFLLFSIYMHAQVPQLVPYRKGDKWGYADFNKKIVIQPVYDGVAFFKGPSAAVTIDTVLYLIDEKGRRISYKEYDDISDFNDGYAAVKQNGLFGFINNKGTEVVKPQYVSVGRFAEGRAAILVNKKIGFIDEKGKVVIEPQYDAAYDYFKEGFILVRKDNRFYYIDVNGKELRIDPEYRPLTLFSEGLAAVMKRVADPPGSKDTTTYWGFINPQGKLAFNWLPLGYDIVTGYSEGYAVVKKNKMYFYVNAQGAVLKDTFYVFNDFKEGYTTAVYYSSRPGDTRADAYIFDKNFTPIKKIVNVANIGKFANGLVAVKSSFNGEVKYYNTKGEVAFEKVYEDGGEFKDGIAVVKKNGKLGCIDTKGNEYWED